MRGSCAGAALAVKAEVVEARRKGNPKGGLWVEAPWQPCILYSARVNVSVKVLDFVQFGGRYLTVPVNRSGGLT